MIFKYLECKDILFYLLYILIFEITLILNTFKITQIYQIELLTNFLRSIFQNYQFRVYMYNDQYILMVYIKQEQFLYRIHKKTFVFSYINNELT